MADNLPINFPIPGESAIASYNWTDIAEGTGIVKLYAFASRSNTTRNYNLSNAINQSEADTFTLAGVEGEAPYKDFNLSGFNLPKVVRGSAIVSGYYNYTGNVAGRTSYLTATLVKWDGSSETTIGSARTQELTAAAAVNFTFVISLPLTHFSRGDILRLKMTATIGGAAHATQSTWDININPSGTAPLVAQVPFRVEI